MGTEIQPVWADFWRGLCWVMLPDGTVRRPYNLLDQLGWRALGVYVIGRTVVGEAEVKTDFIPVDHDFTALSQAIRFRPGSLDDEIPWPPGHIPTCFETMVFGGPADNYTIRRKTLQEARRNHDRVVRKLRRYERLSPRPGARPLG